MGFNQVYKSLVEIFPQIDARVLRAVAVEHCKDPDAAVEAVLGEIIPFFVERSRPSSPLTGCNFVGESSQAFLVGVPSGSQTFACLSLDARTLTEAQNSCDVNDENEQFTNEAGDKCNGPTDNAYNRHCEGDDKNGENATQVEVSGGPGIEDSISGNNFPESSIIVSFDGIPSHTPKTLQEVDESVDQKMDLIQEREEIPCNIANKCISPSNEGNNLGKASADGNSIFDRTTSVSVRGLTNSPLESSVQLEELPYMHESNSEKLEASVSGDNASKLETKSSVISTEDVSTLSMTMPQSSQIRAIAVLEELIAHAKNNKEALSSAMESAISLMKEVELKEESAEKAKAEAAERGAHILDKVQELKKMLQHAKEANDMNAGEVYGEKSILATELRELQARALSLSDERDKARGLLDEMHETLKERLAAAENEINSAEQEKLEKEEASQKSLADLELDMEKVVESSKILKQQAEHNSKLQEFLVDQGRVVDTLQGEIAVICEDVRLLKEKFDERVPVSKSLFSSQTSFILAFSSRYSKSIIEDQGKPVLDADDSVQIQKDRDHDQVAEEEARRDDRSKLVDDGWDIFDKLEIYA